VKIGFNIGGMRLSLLFFWFSLGILVGVPDLKAGVYSVTTLADSGPGSLREALQSADKDRQPSSITFQVGGTIYLVTYLPMLKEGFTTIDGTTAPSPGVILDGSIIREPSNGRGVIEIRSSNNTVKGLTITHFGRKIDGIRMKQNASGNLVERNRIVDWGEDEAISVARESYENRIIGNTISGRRGVRAILLGANASALIADNTISDTRGGVRIHGEVKPGDGFKGFARIERNTIENNLYGIFIDRRGEATIVGNRLRRNGGYAIQVLNGKATIENNVIEGIPGGTWKENAAIRIRAESAAVVRPNHIAHYSGSGISIDPESQVEMIEEKSTQTRVKN